jgi:hypothetical protein
MHLMTRAKAWLLTVFMLLGGTASPPSVATASEGGFVSRRATLKAMRDEKAQVNPVAEIAIGGILFAIAILIVLRFYPLMTSVVAEAQADANSTASDNSLLGLLPTLFVVFLLMGGVSLVIHGIKGLKEGL